MLPTPDTQPDAGMPTAAEALAIFDQIIEQMTGRKADFDTVAKARAVLAEIIAVSDG
jgi:hypothetical protein